GITADADHGARLNGLQKIGQRPVADLLQGFEFRFSEFAGHQIAVVGEEQQRAIVPHEELFEKTFLRSETLPGPAPEPLARAFAAGALEARDGVLAVLLGKWRRERLVDVQPLPRHAD